MRNLTFILLIFSLHFTACNKEEATLAEDYFVRSEGADLGIHVRGNPDKKKYIFVVHGGPGGNGLEYRLGSWSKIMEEQYVMVYYDQRGSGSSKGQISPDDVDIDLFVRDLDAAVQSVINKYGQDIELYLFGHSWGGTLGTAYVLEHQNKLAGWIESNGAHDIPRLNQTLVVMLDSLGQREIDAGNNVSQWQSLVDFARSLDTANISAEQSGELNSKAFEAEQLITEITSDPNGDIGQLYNYFANWGVDPLTSSVSGNQINGALGDDIETLSYTNRLSEIKIPTLLLWGAYDFVVPPQLMYDAEAAIDSNLVEAVLFNTSGHSPMGNQPEAYTEVFINWVERQ